MQHPEDAAHRITLEMNVGMLLADGRHHQCVVSVRGCQRCEACNRLRMNRDLVAPCHPDTRSSQAARERSTKEDGIEHTGRRGLLYALESGGVSTVLHVLAHQR